MRDLVGEVLSNRYRLVSRVAGGGMGDVYRGHDLLLDRTVAVKVLQHSLAEDPALVARFRAEARAAARLNHTNIVAVHDWGAEADQTYYMVMEYVAGTDLRDVLVSRGPLAPRQAAEIVAVVCDALAVAHAAGLVHRDVKPENILIARGGVVKVADFGIAAVTDADHAIPGGVAGTLRYLSPEQARGEEATTASDVWAAGAVLAELLTGRPPLQGSGPDILQRRASEAPIAPSSIDSAVPKDLDEIVLRACSVVPESRFADASDMARALRLAASRLPEAHPVETLLEEVTGEIRLPEASPTTFLAKGRRKSRRRFGAGRLGAIVIALLVAAFGVYKGMDALVGPVMVAVPTLVGLTKAEAEDAAEEVGLRLEIQRRRHPEVEAGSVIAQTPSQGELEEGSPVTIVVSAGPPLEAVPDLVGMKFEAAQTRLLALNLEVKETRRYDEAEAGTVIAQQPPDGRLEWGETVTLVVSKGPQPVEVPDVAGMAADKAKGTLKDAGFQVALTTAYSDDVPEDKVLSTSPGGGAVVAEGSTVEVVVSAGPEFRELRMPDVRQMGIDEARARLEALGFQQIRIVQSCGGGGTIVAEQQPLPGATVKENDPVDLFTC
ncbi:MAG: Stk1 family PASTA domain-containing Ser/Thr kinase [Actinomycetota bacterium]